MTSALALIGLLALACIVVYAIGHSARAAQHVRFDVRVLRDERRVGK